MELIAGTNNNWSRKCYVIHQLMICCMQDILIEAKMVREWGVWEASYNFSVAIGAIIGGFVVIGFGFITLFGFMGLLCVAVSFFLWRLPNEEL